MKATSNPPPQNAGVSTEVKPDEVYNLAAQSDLELDDFIAAPLGIYSWCILQDRQ